MDKTTEGLALALKFRKTRQELIASNIANAETPGYKSKKIDFEDALANALETDESQVLKTTDKKHFNVGGGGFNNLQPEIYDEPNGVESMDGNTVNRDEEMAEMANNKVLYDANVQMINKKLGLMKYIVGQER